MLPFCIVQTTQTNHFFCPKLKYSKNNNTVAKIMGLQNTKKSAFLSFQNICWEWGRGAHSGADLNILCKHFKNLKYNNFGLNCHFVETR